MITYIRTLTTIILLMLSASFTYAGKWRDGSLLSNGRWVKVRVANEGVYQLSKSYLSSVGFSNPDNVRLYGYNLPLLPEANDANTLDDLVEIPLYKRASDGALLFYSKGLIDWKRSSQSSTFTHTVNPYSKYVYYFLTEDTNAAPRMQKAQAAAPSRNVQSTYLAHTLIDPDEFSFINAGRTFFERYDYASGYRKVYNMQLEGTPIGDVRLAVQFAAAGKSMSSLTVRSDSNAIGTINFSPLAEFEYANVNSATYSIANILTDKLRITLQHNRTDGISGHLDYLRASYMTSLSITDKTYLAFTPNSSGNTTFQLKHKDKVSVWKVTSPLSTSEMETTDADGTLSFNTNATTINDQFVAVRTDADFPTPEKVGKIDNQNLHALHDIDLLIIIPSNGRLLEQAQRLGEAHAVYDNMTYAVVRADQVYNEFSSGTPDATAYRRIMKMLYDKASASSAPDARFPRNLLLFGGCNWDHRLVTSGMSSRSTDDYLLCYESYNSWSHTDSYVSEEYFCVLDDGEGVSPLKEKPDAGVGRIPVTTPAEAKSVVDKLIAYIENRKAGAWKNTICFMADDGNNNTHMKDAEAVITNTRTLYPDFYYKRIYWDSYERKQSATGFSYPDAYNAINKIMDDGALVMNYTGHGAAYCLSHEQTLKTADFQRWSSPRLPLWITAGCDICPFDMNEENLACEALLNSKGAAMGIISTARTVYSSPNRVINRYLMRHLFETTESGTRYTIGEALAMAKCDIVQPYISRQDSINKAQFVLMGDPAITMLAPTYKVRIDSINGEAVSSSSSPLFKAGDIVKMTGHIVDERGLTVPTFNGTITPTILDAEQDIVCKNNAGDDIDNFVYQDHPQTIYSGSSLIKGGKFSLSFPVPLDILYSDSKGLMYLYAINDSCTIEANGTFDRFTVGGTNTELATDTIGPSIIIGFLTDHYGAPVFDESPTIMVSISDASGINTTGNGIGHDIVAIVDNDESLTFSLNSYYNQTLGDFTSGSIRYTLSSLPTGKHTLMVRAFDSYNNPGMATIEFEVVEGLQKRIEIFDTAGRLYTDNPSNPLPPGIYIRRITYSSDATGYENRKSEKFIVKGYPKR
ncbi:MAG: type IX secretion system sortase PorU [Bacteroidaceae bacterium]|nr:type IX secretion system sortase PorU [Bacteroidaceae bacterium]